MARNRNDYYASSLELLLDTITNAFGGILFLALLVVVLLQSSSKTRSKIAEVSPNEISEMRSTLQNLENKIAALNLEVQAREAIASNLADPQTEAVIRDLSNVRQLNNELIKEKSSLLESISHLQESTSSLKEKNTQLTTDIDDVMLSLDKVRESLEEERAKRKINSPFPEERSSLKSHIPATVRYGRWYLDRNSNGEINLDDFAVLEDSGNYLTVSPKPYRGTPIEENENLSRKLHEYLNTQNPNEVYVEIAIWDDSYEEFQYLRDYLVERGFEYRLVVVKDGEKVSEGYVSNPKVQ